ncbi:MAG: 30S ribosomal protein S7 [Candidatus Mycalebacterium zealandia]|nr:MAG: 30S ribosomal protein S7 [Candidatus Mycalebacterium zealandia]
MVRKSSSAKIRVESDPRFGDVFVAKFLNSLMLDGKKSKAEQIFYGVLDLLSEKANTKEPIKVFFSAMENIKPSLEVRSRRVGGATYQVPMEVKPVRRNYLAIRWLLDAARKRTEHGVREKLALEILDASQNRGTAIKKREDTHKMAEANRAFAHYRW